MQEEKLLERGDWDRLREAMENGQPLEEDKRNLATEYRVTAAVEPLTGKLASLRGKPVVLTIRRTFRGGHSSVQNFNSIEEAQLLLYGKVLYERKTKKKGKRGSV